MGSARSISNSGVMTFWMTRSVPIKRRVRWIYMPIINVSTPVYWKKYPRCLNPSKGDLFVTGVLVDMIISFLPLVQMRGVLDGFGVLLIARRRREYRQHHDRGMLRVMIDGLRGLAQLRPSC